MLFSLLFGLIIGAGAVVFALQNVFPVTVTFLGWELTSSLAVLLILSMVVGALISMLLTIPGAFKNHFAISRLQKENRKLAEKIVEDAPTEKEVVITTVEVPHKTN